VTTVERLLHPQPPRITIIGRNGSSGQWSAEITNSDLVEEKFEIEKVKTRIVGT
jgi:hypothetical protein